MTQHKLRELVRAANPVDSAFLLGGEDDVRLMYKATMSRVRNPQPSAVLLEAPAERKRDMQTQGRPVQLEPTPKPPVRRKWLIPALVAAAAVVIAVTVPIWLLGGSSEPELDVVQPATTVVTPTPTAPAVLGAFLEQYLAGDVVGAMQYVDPEVTSLFTADQLQDQIAFAGILYPPDDTAAITCEDSGFGNFVRCTITYDPDSLFSTFGVTEETWSAEIVDGRIASYQDQPVRYTGFQNDLAQFAETQDPVGFEDTCSGPHTRNNLVPNTARCALFLRSHLDAFVANS